MLRWPTRPHLLERVATIAANDPAAVAAAKDTIRSWRLPAIEAAEATENAAFRVLLDRFR